jgi:hypothetical protein
VVRGGGGSGGVRGVGDAGRLLRPAARGTRCH